MTTTVTRLADTLQTLFTTTADQIAQQTGFIQRRRVLTGASVAQGLVFTWLDNPDATLDELTQGLARAGTPITPQALDERFTPAAADFFRQLLQSALTTVLHAPATTLPLLQRFRGVYLLDSTCRALPAALAELWPGCGGSKPTTCQAMLKVQLRYEVSTGTLDRLTLHPGRESDARTPAQTQPLPAGCLRLADLGYFDLDVLGDYDRAGVFFISRIQSGTKVHDDHDRSWSLPQWLARQTGTQVDTWVRVGHQRLRCRVIARRAPRAVVAKRRRQARVQARKHGQQVSPAKWQMCAWTVFITNLPETRADADEVWVLYRLRWQIELLFKLWKSDGKIDESRGGQPYRILTELYAKLLGMVTQHWVLLVSGGGLSARSVRKAARAVRRQALQLASALGCHRWLVRVLRLVGRCVRSSGRVQRRRKRPSAYQTVQNPRQNGLT